MKIFIIAWILCSEFDRGSSTPSSTSTAATLPMPGFSYLVSSSSWWLWRCFLGEVNVAYISDGMREQRKPGGTIHLPWVEVNTGYISWVGQIVYAFVDLIRVAGSCLKRHSPLPFHLNCHCSDQPTNLSQPQWRDEVDVERSSQNLWNGTFHRALFDPTSLCYKVLRLDENITCISFELLKRSSYVTKRRYHERWVLWTWVLNPPRSYQY